MRQWFSRHYLVASTAIGVAFYLISQIIGMLAHADGKLVFVQFFLGMIAGGLVVSHVRDSEAR